jgi:hypothetical protein
MNPIICMRIPKPDPALVAEAAKYAIADLHESLGAVQGRMALMSPRMRPLRARCGAMSPARSRQRRGSPASLPTGPCAISRRCAA